MRLALWLQTGVFTFVDYRKRENKILRSIFTFILLGFYSIAFANPVALDRSEVNAFSKQSIEALLAESWVPGAALAVVQGAEVVSLQSFGIADNVTGESIDPQTSLFRIGSISKTMTALAALRLVDKGLLEFDRDINDYLSSVKFPEFEGGPVTLRKLLKHRGGFEGLSIFHIIVTENEHVDMTPCGSVDAPRTSDSDQR